jgi:lipid-A-disaccharide synthase
VVYYISPQVWAWRPSRVMEIRHLVSQMLVVLPFEQSFFQERGVRARFVGHPLVEQLPAKTDRAEARAELGLPPTQGPVVAVLPGSRRQEVERHLPRMLQGILLLRRRYPEVHPVIPVASTISRQLVEKVVRRSGVLASVIEGRATDTLVASDIALVASGTSTLQAALLSRPMVVVYRVSWLSFQILKRLVNVAHIALVNLIVGRKLVPELIQDNFTPQRVESELGAILSDPVVRVRLNQDFARLRRQLGGPGASGKVADVVLGYLAESTEDKSGQLWG